MKNQKGITLITLAITIIVMLIIAGTATIASLDSVRNAKKSSFITELEMIGAKVDIIYQKRKQNEDDKKYYDSLGQDISVLEQSKLETILNGTPKEGYRYFSKEDLKKLDLDDVSQDVIINYDTRDVISVTGIGIDGIVYYRLSDIPGYKGYKVEYVDKNDKAPTFTVEVNKLSSTWQIMLKDIIYPSNVAGGVVNYKLHNSQNWILVGENTFFEVKNPRII